MDKKKLIYFALGSLVLFSSCSQEGPEEKPSGETNRIYFRSYLPTVTQTRAGIITTGNFTTAQVTCFNPYDNDYIDPETGEITPYFEDVRFEKGDDDRFFSQGDNDCRWPGTESELHFFAYYPSAESMQKISGEEYFNLVNKSQTQTLTGNPLFDYKMERFRVARDIADQSDFLTAYTTGTLTKNSDAGIKLDFRHQLARVELSAWSGSDKYDFEIAGVRIGNPLVEGDFNFRTLMLTTGQISPWQNTGKQAPVEHIFGAGESIVLLSKSAGSHDNENSAVSVMGCAGPAMVIPMTERIEAWQGKADPDMDPAVTYTTDKMYFSLLLRVKNKAGEVAYPYPNDRDSMTVIHLAVDTEGTVTKRLYNIDGKYYTTPAKDEETLYVPDENETICGFGWASLPVPAKWEAGKIYTYKLNYTEGIGWHDPADPHPGEPIIERGQIPFAVTVEEWIPAEDYNPDINVPKR